MRSCIYASIENFIKNGNKKGYIKAKTKAHYHLIVLIAAPWKNRSNEHETH